MIKEAVHEVESQMQAAESRSPLAKEGELSGAMPSPAETETESVDDARDIEAAVVEGAKLDETIRELKDELADAEGTAELLEVDKSYKIYTRAYDEIIRAEQLDDPKDKIQRYRRVAAHASTIQKKLGALSPKSRLSWRRSLRILLLP